MGHAYLVAAHHQMQLLQILLHLIDDERNEIYLHVDKKCKEFMKEEQFIKIRTDVNSSLKDVLLNKSKDILNEENIKKEYSNESESESKSIKSKEESNNKNIGSKKITIYVSGEVKNPGIVTLNSDQRLASAVEKLGGVTENADMNNINLAMKLEDEMHYIIPKKGEKIETSTNNDKMNSSNNTISQNTYTSKENQESKDSDKIDINTADIEELDKIPGVGEATANKILNYREENGQFKSIEEIKNVNGIGEKKFENMKELICVK